MSVRVAMRLYQLAWGCAIPLLRLNRRLRQGLAQRTLQEIPGKADLWIQAASVGEAQLAREIVLSLQPPEPLRILLTTYTSQGMEILGKIREDAKGKALHIETAFFPFDQPSLTDRAVSAVQPRLLLLLESELWPGLLNSCRQRGIPVLVANGRMSAKSLRHYLLWPGLWLALRPQRILAMSSENSTRFASLFGPDGVETVPNIKFDRISEQPLPTAAANPLTHLFSQQSATRLIVLGSIRKEEEDAVARMITALRAAVPQATIALFPRHMHRIASWEKRLATLPCQLRSQLAGPVGAGAVILWDTMGEMLPAFLLADAAFIGGSLAPVGGQNFLEPLQCGLKPVIGPHWSNFYWIGNEIFTDNLVFQAQDWQEAARLLVDSAKIPPQREQTRRELMRYVAERRGGTSATCAVINNLLFEKNNITLSP